MRVRLAICFAFLLLSALVPGPDVHAQTLANEPEVILLRADPEIITADGQSSATITAEVRTRQNALVPDGTTVRFTTTAGTVSQSVLTRNGVARATLRSSAEEGVAEVSATAGLRAIARVSVTFTSEKLPGQQMKPFVRIEGESLQFVPDKSFLDAAGSVRLTYRSFYVTADLLQLDTGALRLKARGKVHLRSGGKELIADMLSLDMQQATGALVAVDDNGKLRRQTFRGYALTTTDETSSFPQGTFEMQELGDPRAVMTARKMTIFPGDKMQFSGFSLYVNGAKVLGLPFYVLSLNPYGPDADQYLSYDSTGGLSVNLPFYWTMTDNTNGSIRLVRQSRLSYDGYSVRPGWQLGLEQRYNFGTENHGVLDLDAITSKDFGVRWRHDQQWDSKTHSYFSIDSPTHNDMYARSEFYHQTGLGDLSLSTDTSILPHVLPSLSSRMYFRFRPGTIKGPNIQYYWSTNLAWSQVNGHSALEEGVDLQIHPPSLNLGKMTSLQFYTGGGWANTESGTGPTAQASATLMRRLGKGTTASLRYSYYFSGLTSQYFGSNSSQSLTGQIFAGGSQRWNASLTGTLMPTTGDLTAYGSLIYFPFHNWRLELRPTYTQYGGSVVGSPSSTNLDIYLARQIAGRDLALRWSTLDHRIRFEVGTTALRF